MDFLLRKEKKIVIPAYSLLVINDKLCELLLLDRNCKESSTEHAFVKLLLIFILFTPGIHT